MGSEAVGTSVLMGAQKGELNLGKLRARAEDLRQAILDLIHLLSTSSGSVTWPAALDRFSLINVLWQQTLDELRGATKHYVARPRSVNASTAAVLPIQLSSRKLPEMEVEEARLLRAAEAGAPASDPSLRSSGSPDGDADSLPALMERTDALNRAARALTASTAAEGPGPLDPRGPRRRAMDAAVAAAAADQGVYADPLLEGADRGVPPRHHPLTLAALFGTGL